MVFHDNGAVLIAGAGCQAVDQHAATCAIPPGQALSNTRVELGDLDDRFRSVAAPADAETGLDDFAVFGGRQ